MTDIGPIVVNARSLKLPLTGVGRYTLELMKALEAVGGVQPHYLRNNRCTEGLSVDERPRHRLLSEMLRKGMPRPYGLLQRLRQRAFEHAVQGHSFRLYHEPDYIPLRFDGPTVITVHDLTPFDYPRSHPPARVHWFHARLPRAIEKADAVLTVSEAVRNELLHRFSVRPERVFVTPNGVSEQFRALPAADFPAVRGDLPLEYGGYILSVATFEPRKNLIALVEAFEQLPAPLRRRFPLVVAGASGWGSRRADAALDRLVRRGEAVIAGYVDDHQLRALYSGAVLFVQPSLYEGFGLPTAEAMACGTAVIASGRGGLSEVVNGNGVQVEPEDRDGIREAMQGLLEDEHGRLRLAEQGRKHIGKFTWQACARRTLQAYGHASGVQARG